MGAIKVSKPSDTNNKTSGVVAGPPGTGKSWLLGTVAEEEGNDPLLVATLAKEVESTLYKRYDIPYVPIDDPDWSPSQDKLESTGFRKFTDLMVELLDDEKFGFVLIDSGTQLAELAWHYSLLPHNVASPAMLEEGNNRWLPYETLDIYMTEAVIKATNLTMAEKAKRPKHVFFTWHVRPQQDEMWTKATGVKKSKDQKSEGIEYEGKLLPQVRGQFRRRLMEYVSTFVWTDIKLLYDGPKQVGVDYLIQVMGDNERHCKVPGPKPEEMYIPNNWKSLKQFLDAQAQKEQKAVKQALKIKK